MKVLFIGFSSLVERRVLQAVASLPEIDRIYIASRRDISADVIPAGKRGRTWRGYAQALAECEPCIAYVSLPNDLHAEWTRRALEFGFHVLVDKPSFLKVTDAHSLAALADDRGICLAEANVWHYHPLALTMKNIINEAGGLPQVIYTTFSSPPMGADNFRYDAARGGGVILDRGPYAVSCGRFFFGAPPEEVICRNSSSHRGQGVDESCSFMMRYEGGGILQGFFSIGAEYCNAVSAIGPSYSLDAERVFSPPPDYVGTVQVKRSNRLEIVPVAAADTFALFFKDVLGALRNGSFRRFSQVMIQDIEVLNRLRITSEGALDDNQGVGLFD